MQTISVVVPVYRGELTLEPLLAEIEPLTTEKSSGGISFRVGEVLQATTSILDSPN